MTQKLLTTSVDEEIAEASLSEPISSMVDIVARMTDAEMFLQLKVSSFDLILSLDFIMQLLKFLHVPEEKVVVVGSPPAVVNTAPAASGVVTAAAVSQTGKCKFRQKIDYEI